MNVDVTALYAPSVAQVGLPSASVPPDYWGSCRTLRSSKALRSHKEECNLRDLPVQAVKPLVLLPTSMPVSDKNRKRAMQMLCNEVFVTKRHRHHRFLVTFMKDVVY